MQRSIILLILVFSSSSASECGVCEQVAKYFIDKGKDYVCDETADVACEVIGGGPENPLADACVALMDLVACPIIIKKIEEGHDTPGLLCEALDACKGGSNYIGMPDEPEEVFFGLTLAVIVAIITSTAATITLALASALIGVVAVMLNKRRARLEKNEQTEEDPDFADESGTVDESKVEDESKAEAVASTVDESLTD